MNDPLAALLHSLRRILVPIGIVAGIAAGTAGLLERKRKKH